MKNIIQLILISFFIFFLFNITHKPALTNIKYVEIAGERIDVELALTKRAHMLGLSIKENLPEGEGMLFIFPKSGEYSFWMKDMKFPIDIIWIDENRRVVFIQPNAKPESYPATFTPEDDALYVLEVSAGFSQKNNLKVGDKVEFGY